MPADLTRFDFHVMRFMHSEDVKAMTAEEVGQYVLLLSEAWLTGKDTTLTSDLPTLARLARVTEVSPRVLQKFQLVETQWGQRYRNPVLYGEWMRAAERSDAGRKSVESRWNNERNTNVENTTVLQSLYPSQAKPIQTEPNQSNEMGDFKNLAIRYRRAFGIKPGKNNLSRKNYAAACQQHSENTVLACFDEWAQQNQWIREWAQTGKLHSDGLRKFFEELPELVEVEAAATAEEKLSEPVFDVAAAAKQNQTDLQNFMANFNEEDEAAKRVEENPDALFGA